MRAFKDIHIYRSDFVAIIEIQRPPHNYFDLPLIQDLVEALHAIDIDDSFRAVVIAAQGRSFCAGADLQDPERQREPTKAFGTGRTSPLYEAGAQLLCNRKPVVGAIHGPAIEGGLGLALIADFRVTCPEAWFSANFARLGLYPGFGLTAMLPDLIGKNRAELMFYTGRRISGNVALEWGLVNACVSLEKVRDEAIALASEIAQAAPLSVQALRFAMRKDLFQRVTTAIETEFSLQRQLSATEDFKEGVRAASERRPANFKGL